MISTWGVEHGEVSKIAMRVTYHGTSAKAAKGIMRNGFQNRDAGELRPPGVFVSPDRKVGRIYSAAHGKKGRLIRVTTTGPAGQKFPGRMSDQARHAWGERIDADQVVTTRVVEGARSRRKVALAAGAGAATAGAGATAASRRKR